MASCSTDEDGLEQSRVAPLSLVFCGGVREGPMTSVEDESAWLAQPRFLRPHQNDGRDLYPMGTIDDDRGAVIASPGRVPAREQ
eukprot:11003000-Heterocapsa_arctica.AAC.1